MTSVPFLKSWPVTIPCKRKRIKWATKKLIKKKGKGKKRAREKDRNRFAKKFKFRLVGMREKQKAVYLRPSSRKICFFCCILMLISRKPVQRRGTGEK